MIPRRLLRTLALLTGIAALAACEMPAPEVSAPVEPEGPVRVALLVPLGSEDGQREALARSIVNAAEMAQRDLSGVQLELQVYPTAGDPATAATAAQRAVDEGADVVLGPLFATATTAVAPIAGARGLQVLSFSNNPAIAGGNVHLLGTTFDNNARRIVGYAARNELRDVAIVYPQGAEGELARAAVAQAVAAEGGRVAAEGAYPLSVQGIIAAMPDIARDIKGGGANVVVLTDGPTGGLTFVAETLRGLGIRAGVVTFAGTQRWDTSPQAMAQPGLEGGWFVAPDQALASQFESRYQDAYGAAPHPLAGLGYDGIAAIGALIAEARTEGRNDPFSTARLTQPEGFAGVMGAFRFLPGGSNERALAVFEVIDGTAQQVDAAPRSFADRGA